MGTSDSPADRYFVSPHPGTTTHAYDREKVSSEYWRVSVCGQSWAKTTNAKSFNANRRDIDCGSCRRILRNRGVLA